MNLSTRCIMIRPTPMEGPDVLAIQQRLQKIGFDPGPVDGIFGKQSDLSLRRFQKSRNLKPDGIVGPDTWLWLGIDSPFATQNNLTTPRIYVHLDTRTLNLVTAEKATTYPVAIGKPSTPSPIGEWTIVQKIKNPGGPFGVRWMRLSVPWGGYGIHGTNNPSSIGKAVSHGCIRMYNEDVIKVYDVVPLGTPVSITGNTKIARVLRIGSRGSDVKGVQAMLSYLGYYSKNVDGHYGIATKKAVINLQAEHGLDPNGVLNLVSHKTLQAVYDIHQYSQSAAVSELTFNSL